MNRAMNRAMNVAFPFALDATGRSAAANDDEHVRQMIEQLLLTSRGERVNRPDFGSDLMQIVFGPNAPELAMALQMTLQATLRQHLGDLIEVASLEVTSEDARFEVDVRYVVRATGRTDVVRLQGGGP